MNPENLIKIKERISKLLERAAYTSASHTLSDAKEVENEAANAAALAQELMKQYKLEESEFYKTHTEIKYEPLIGVSTIDNPFLSKRPIEYRKPWSEFLANCIAQGYYCKVTVHSRYGKLNFYGIDFDRDIAIMMFEKIGAIAFEACKIEMNKAKDLIGKKTFDIKAKKMTEHPKTWLGDEFFIDNFMFGFGSKLLENYQKSQEDHNNDNLDKIDEFIRVNKQYNEVNADEFNFAIGQNVDVQQIGRKYGNFTTKQKADKINKAANIELSKNIRKVDDNRVGEVFLLIDDSGSMCGDKIQQAKAGVFDFAKDAIEKRFAVGVIRFDHEVNKLVEPTLEITEENKRAINALYGRGSTNILLAMREAANSWKSYHRFKRTIVIATDGRTSYADECIEYAKLLKASGVQILTIGTYDADEQFLKEISSENKTLQVEDNGIRNALKGMAGYLTA
jgi:Mg-chelatase subunit ChlD